MSNPWDVPPLPAKGDDDIELTYAGVGHVLSQWEEVELLLSDIYSHFVGKPNQYQAIHKYGEPGLFKDRLAEVTKRAHYHIRDQTTEARFDELMNEVKRYSDRRNDVAHGIVRPMEWFRPLDPIKLGTGREPAGYAIVPPHFKFKKFDANNLPSYAYTWAAMIELETNLFDLCNRILDFREELFPWPWQ